MTKLARMLCLILLLSALLFPASAFASSNHDMKNQKSFFASITDLFSFFGNSGSSNKKEDYGKYYSDKDWGEDPWSKSGKDKDKNKDKGKGKDKDHKDRWDKDKYDSRKIWENYYCW